MHGPSPKPSPNVRGRRILASICIAAALLSAACRDDATAPEARAGEISTGFEGAALEGWTKTDDGFDIDLSPSPHGRWRWYSFRLHGREDLPTTFRVIDAQSAAWESAWFFDRPVVSSDGGRSWERISESFYSGFFFRFTYTPESDDDWIAWVPVYNFSRWTERFDRLRDDPLVIDASVVGESLEGRPLHHLLVTDPELQEVRRPGIWVVARQHPGETPGSWMLEGFLDWLLGETAEARALRRAAEVHVVPFLNPDGVVNGYYRVNGAGLDLNRVWDAADPESAPTVATTKHLLSDWVKAGGELRLFVDLHGNPGGRRNFMFFNGDDPDRAREARSLMTAFESVTPLFDAEGAVAVENWPAVAQGWVEGTFGAQAVTLEASHQDIIHGPHAHRYMNVADYRELGEGLGVAIVETLFGESSSVDGAAGAPGAKASSPRPD